MLKKIFLLALYFTVPIPGILYQCKFTTQNYRSKISPRIYSNRGSLCNNAINLITSQSEVSKAVSELAACGEIALDLEFDRDRFAYGFTLCLIQVYANNKYYILDPMTRIDLSTFFKEVLENPKIQKVIHAPGEDIRLIRSLGYTIKNVFDTEKAVKLIE